MSRYRSIASALEPYRPDVDGPWTLAEAAHAARRIGFGATAERVKTIRAKGPLAAAEFEVSGAKKRDESTTLEAWSFAERAAQRNDIETLRAAWVNRLSLAEFPLAERMCLFWHDHFATSNTKVQSAADMHRQNRIFFDMGLGKFGPMLHAVAKDPAMLRWLDSDTNKKGIPNENFARELFELFSLGIGKYTEADILEAARAFTGWRADRHVFKIDATARDDGKKSVFGKTISHGEEVVDLCLEKKECARFIAGKLWREFVADDLSPDLAEALGAEFENVGMDIGAFLERLFASRAFFSADARFGLYRSPAALVVGAVRSLDARGNFTALGAAMAEMGQELFCPPSVKGWDDGRAWITTATFSARRRFAAEVARGDEGRFKLRTSAKTDGIASHLQMILADLEDNGAKKGESSPFATAARILETNEAQLF